MCLENIFDRIGNSRVKLNQPKCKFGVDNVGYVGHVLSKDGLKPCPDRIHAIWDMPASQGKGELSMFLGMMTYLSKLMPHLSEVTAVHRQLMKTNVVWLWEPHHQRAFVELKRLVSETPVMKFYDVNQPVTLATVASKYGYGS